MLAADIVAALREEFTPIAATTSGTDEWSLLTEVPSTGSPVHRVDPVVRVIDVLLVRNWGSGRNPYERIAVEVKVSRGDFQRDTARKRAPWEALAHRFAYAVPDGLVAPGEVPDGCWLIEVSDGPCDPGTPGHRACPPGRRAHWNRRVKGARRDPGGFPDALAVLCARRASRAEQKIGYPGRDPEAAESLVEDLRVARREIRRLQAEVEESRRRCEETALLVAPLLPQQCADCGLPLVPGPGRGGGVGWRHESRLLDAACEQARGGRWWAVPEPASVRWARGGAC